MAPPDKMRDCPTGTGHALHIDLLAVEVTTVLGRSGGLSPSLDGPRFAALGEQESAS